MPSSRARSVTTASRSARPRSSAACSAATSASAASAGARRSCGIAPGAPAASCPGPRAAATTGQRRIDVDSRLAASSAVRNVVAAPAADPSRAAAAAAAAAGRRHRDSRAGLVGAAAARAATDGRRVDRELAPRRRGPDHRLLPGAHQGLGRLLGPSRSSSSPRIEVRILVRSVAVAFSSSSNRPWGISTARVNWSKLSPRSPVILVGDRPGAVDLHRSVAVDQLVGAGGAVAAAGAGDRPLVAVGGEDQLDDQALLAVGDHARRANPPAHVLRA